MPREIVCVDTDPNGPNDCRCITRIGYASTSGGTNYRSREQAHDDIKERGIKYYVLHDGSRSYAEARTRGGTKYIRTAPTDTKEDNLLKQPSC